MKIISAPGADAELKYTSSDWSVAKPPGRRHGALDRQGRDGPGTYRVASVGRQPVLSRAQVRAPGNGGQSPVALPGRR